MNELEKKDLLGKLYTLRAGLSIISIKKDEVVEIDSQANNDINKVVQIQKNNLCIKEKTSEEDVEEELKANDLVFDYSDFERFDYSTEYATRQSEWSKNNESSKLTTIIDKNQLNPKVIEGINLGINYHIQNNKKGIIGWSIALVIFGLAFIVGLIHAVIAGLHGTDDSYAMMFIIGAIVAIGGLVISLKSVISLFKKLSNVRRFKRVLNNHMTYIDNYKLFHDNLCEIINENTKKTTQLQYESNEIYLSLQKEFSSLIDVRDWDNLDLIIYNIETQRADSIKECLQLVDREIQTQRIEKAIYTATNYIAKVLIDNFKVLIDTINTNFNSLFSQIGLLINLTATNTALQAKSLETSQKLMDDVRYMREHKS